MGEGEGEGNGRGEGGGMGREGGGVGRGGVREGRHGGWEEGGRRGKCRISSMPWVHTKLEHRDHTIVLTCCSVHGWIQGGAALPFGGGRFLLNSPTGLSSPTHWEYDTFFLLTYVECDWRSHSTLKTNR